MVSHTSRKFIDDVVTSRVDGYFWSQSMYAFLFCATVDKNTWETKRERGTRLVDAGGVFIGKISARG